MKPPKYIIVWERLLKTIWRRLPLPNRAKFKLRRIYTKFFLKNTKITQKGYRFLDAKTVLNKITHATMEFKKAETVQVSIIIPVFNRFLYTYNCLNSILTNSEDVNYEIIIVDDGSSDRTTEFPASIKGIRLLRNERNLGFIASCNLGAREATGTYLVFLNNDTIVTPNWLSRLLKTFETFPDAGLAGAKLIYPNGRLQEAGGIVWRDGSACNYGWLDDPDYPRYNYLREVDYCSGACLMIPRDLFISLGLFDPRFTPGYYEDTDLAFRVREAGKKVYYQPLATVIHYEGITSGTDVSKGIKQYQIINQQKFYERWKTILLDHAEPGVSLKTETERRIKKRVLIVDAYICLPDQDSGSLRMFNILGIFQDLGYKVTFFPNNLLYPEPYVSNMQSLGIEILTINQIHSLEKYAKENGNSFDVVWLSRFDAAKNYIHMLKKYCTNAMVIFDTVDLNFLREQREAELKKSKRIFKTSRKHKQAELETASQAEVTLVVSQVEKKLLEKENSGLVVHIISNIHEIHNHEIPFFKRRDLLFIGGFEHTPNVDAMTYFATEILPLIQTKLEDIKLYIVGSNPPAEIKSLASDHIIVTGYIHDIEPYLNKCRVSVAPLRWGAGVKGKVNLSMSYGLPVVVTPIAAEGMFLNHGEDALIAHNPEEFADAVIRLYTDANLWQRISQNGLKNVQKYFSYQVAKEALESILAKKQINQ